MTQRQTYVISDIHGQYHLLKKLVEKCYPVEGDRFIFLGDYVDRGAYSYEVIKFLIGLKSEYECEFLLGNHEDMMKKGIADKEYGDRHLWWINGGKATVDSFNKNGVDLLTPVLVPDDIREFFNNLKLYLMDEETKCFFCHAGIDPEVPLDRQPAGFLLWDRNFCYYHAEKYDHNYTIVYGHTPSREVTMYPKAICIDTGAVFYGKMTALQLPERTLIEANNHEIEEDQNTDIDQGSGPLTGGW